MLQCYVIRWLLFVSGLLYIVVIEVWYFEELAENFSVFQWLTELGLKFKCHVSLHLTCSQHFHETEFLCHAFLWNVILQLATGSQSNACNTISTYQLLCLIFLSLAHHFLCYTQQITSKFSSHSLEPSCLLLSCLKF